MLTSFATSLVLWQSLSGCAAIAKPLYLNARQATTTDAAAVTSAPAASASPQSSPATPVTATLFEAENKAFVATPAASPSTPSSGCIIATQTLTTISWFYTFDLAGVTTDTTTIAETTSIETDLLTLTPDIYCQCAGGVIADIGTSYNQVGTAYLFCETGGLPSTTNAVSTLDPKASALPGNPLNPDWADVTCDLPSLQNTDGTTAPEVMWNDCGAEAAWNAMKQTWELDQTTSYYTFTNFILNFFHGPTNTNCDQVGQGSCDGTISCGQYSSPNAVINSPAGYMIFSSMIGLHQILEAFNTGVIAAVGQLGLNVAAFTTEFSPVTAELAAIAKKKQILDIVQVVLGAVLVAVFAAIIPALPAVTLAGGAAIAYDTVATGAYVEFGAVLGLIKDQMADPSIFGAAAEVGAYISGFTNKLEGASTALVKTIFDTPDVLFGLINQGAYWSPSIDPASGSGFYDVSNKIQELIYANALPMAWGTGTQMETTFLATGTGVQGSGTVNGCDGYDPNTVLLSGVLSGANQPVYTPVGADGTQFFQDVFFCINNTPFWLMVGHTDSQYRGIYVAEPTNLASLNGTSWGGLTGDALVGSAVNTWVKNGNQNTNLPANPQDFDTLKSLATGDIINIPGLVQIPVCTFAQAAQGATDDKTNSAQNPFWPCPASGTTG